MTFPIRNITHQIEREAIEILSTQFPKEWIIREMTERDYGIDLYVEIVQKNGFVTGDLLAIQIKGKSTVVFNEKKETTYYGIKESTLNYWLHLPVPVFFVIVCIENRESYWCSIDEENRKSNIIKGTNGEFSVRIGQDHNLSDNGIILFNLIYLREKRWPDILKAIEHSLMFYTSLGPFYLFCKRKKDTEYCSTTVQYLLIQHFESYYLLSRYILSKKPKMLPYWYDKHLEEKSSSKYSTFSYKIVKEFFKDFITDYREAIRLVNLLVVKFQPEYFSKKLPYLYLHLKLRPLTFVESDWYARYYWDEYENDTKEIEKKFFEDFTEYDDWDLIDDLNV